uniref:Uncharacterized protein n=1 Tax=Avena sativa TaxID=4498 RepID=A0ACD5TJ87_AVESA
MDTAGAQATTPNSSSSSAPALNPLDTDPQTALQQRQPMRPRAPPSPHVGDPLFPHDGTMAPVAHTINMAAPSLPSDSLARLPFPLSIHDVHIEQFIKFTVDSTGKNFTRWRKIILFQLARYNARDHVLDGAAYARADEAWRQEDSTIVLWFYGTISEALQDIMLDPDCTAYDAWTRLHTFFYDNREGQAMDLNTQLHDMPHGDLSIDEYCRRLKHIADQLEEEDAPISDRALTMKMIDGLGEKFELQAEILTNMTSYPTFAQAQSRLQLAERKMARKARAGSAQALAVHTSGGRGASRPDSADRGSNISQGGVGRGQA